MRHRLPAHDGACGADCSMTGVLAKMIKLTVEQGLARITLARPEAGNAMSWDFIDSLSRTCEQVAADASVRAVLVDAEGKNFCVGGDIRSFADAPNRGDFIEKLAGRLHEGMLKLAGMDAPLIVAVNGAAAGAGLSLAAAGDLVLAGEGASFTLAYTGLGLTSDGGALWTLPRVIGLRRTQEMAFLNLRVGAAQAQEWGLVTKVVPDDQLQAEALALATRIAAGPTRAFGGIKRLLQGSYGIDYASQLDAEAKAIGEALRTEDGSAAVDSFLARQAPVFNGR